MVMFCMINYLRKYTGNFAVTQHLYSVGMNQYRHRDKNGKKKLQ